MAGRSLINRRYLRVRDAEQEQVDVGKARTAMWHKLGLAVIDPDKMQHEYERQAVINEANKLYGKRAGHESNR